MKNIYSVTQVNLYIKKVFIEDYLLNNIAIRGEVSNCKYHSSGHIYFTLKDDKGAMACVMFNSSRQGLLFQMREGQSVIVHGSIQVYERDGKYQLYAKNITLDGIGQLYQQYEALKIKLEQQGYFDATKKKRLPKFSKRIGIVTASTGAVIQDIMNIAKRRNPYVQLILYPAQVQGSHASQTIVEGIQFLDTLEDPVDIIIIGRGGGSLEDLWAFNEENVAEAIFKAKTPIISAVGHETDVTIADFVADLRAPTPSAAAELAVLDYQNFLNTLDQYNLALNHGLKRKISAYAYEYNQLRLRLNYLNPVNQLNQKKLLLVELDEQLKRCMKNKLKEYKHRLAIYQEQLEGNSPNKALSKGYAYLKNQAGAPITSVSQVKKGDELGIRLRDGDLKVSVTYKRRNRREHDGE